MKMKIEKLQKILAVWWFRIVIYLVLGIVTLAIFEPVAQLLKVKEISNIMPLIMALLPSIAIESLRKGSKWHAFGVGVDKFMLRDLLIAFICVCIMLTVFYLTVLISGNHISVNWDAFNGKIIYYFTFFSGGVAFEELIFRGVIFQALLSRFGDYKGTFIMSVIFCIAHFCNPNINFLSVVNILLAGILLSIMYIQTKSLWLPFFFHLFWNFSISLLIGSNVSGWAEFKPFIAIDNIENLNSLVYGANFGIEAGLPTTILMILFIAVTLFLAKESPYKSAVYFKKRYEESKLLSTK